MAAANVTLAGSQGSQFAASTGVFVATLQKPGGSVTADGTVACWVAEGQDTCAVDGTDQNAIKIPANGTFPLNPTTKKFAFRTDSSTGNMIYKPIG